MSLGQPTRHNVTAGESSRINLINNGGFTNYVTGVEQLRDTAGDQFVLVDRKLYGPVHLAFDPPAEAGSENTLGYWDIYGGATGVEVAPVDATGRLMPSLDGGNLLRAQFLATGTLFLEQEVGNIAGLRGQRLSVMFSGYAFEGAVRVAMVVLVDAEEHSRTEALSTSFGQYRRVGTSVTIPATAKQVTLRLELQGRSGTSVGLSGITALQGPSGALSRFVPSIADTAMPSNTVILYEGDTCPSGYRNVSPAEPIIGLLTGGHAGVMGTATLTTSGGYDTHDHNPNQPNSALEPASADQHSVDTPMPKTGQGLFFTKLFSETAQSAGEVPLIVLGTQHSHTLTSEMTSIPPSFPLVYCQKL